MIENQDIRPAQVIGLVITESVFLGAVGVALGLTVGIGFNSLTAINGIDLSRWSGAMDLVSSLYPVIHPSTDPVNAAIAALATFLMTVLVSVYPAVRAARLRPVMAIRAF